jgi:hypothetical protein
VTSEWLGFDADSHFSRIFGDDLSLRIQSKPEQKQFNSAVMDSGMENSSDEKSVDRFQIHKAVCERINT